MTAKYATTLKKLTGLNEATLILASQNANLKAFNRIVLLYQDELFTLVFWLLGDQDSAEEITQNTFLAAYNGLSRFPNRPIRRWLYQIATNACIDELHHLENHPFQPLDSKSGANEPSLPDGDISNLGASPEKAYKSRELEWQVQQALDQLDVDHRVALVLVDLQDLSYQEAAQILGVSVGTVKTHLAQARLRLHHRLSAKGGIRLLS